MIETGEEPIALSALASWVQLFLIVDHRVFPFDKKVTLMLCRSPLLMLIFFLYIADEVQRGGSAAVIAR